MIMITHLRLLNNHLLHMIIISFTFFLFFFSSSSVLAVKVNPLVDLSTRDELVSVAGYGEEKLSNVLVTGTVLCDACSRGKLLRPRPVSGASVIVSCHTNDRKRMKSNWARGKTDEYGDFIIDIPSHLHAVSNLEHLCLVKVIHLPRESHCHTSIQHKHQVIKLSSVGNGIRTYSAQPIRMTSRSSHGCTSTNTEGRKEN